MEGSSVTKGIFFDRVHQPSPGEIQQALGACYPLWEKLIQFITTNYQIEGEWSSYGPKGFGCGFRYKRKGKALIALYPQNDQIIAQVVLGKTQTEKALSLDPDLIEAQVGIGMVYFHQKRFAEAKRNFEKVIRIKSDFYPAYLWLGVISFLLEDYDAAIKCLEVCPAIKPYSEEPWEFLRMTYQKKGDLKKGQEAENKIVELGERKIEVNPNDGMTLSRLAITYARKGENKKALNAINRVMEIDPTDGWALYNCACTYAHLGKKKDAFTFLEATLESGIMHNIEWVKVDPGFESIRDDPKFQEILSRYSV